MTTVLSIIQSTCYELNKPAPTSVVSATDPSTLQYINLFYATCRELRQMRWWPQLKRSYTINLQTSQGQYPLPQDFYASLPRTQWDQGNKWEMLGPMTDREWDYRLYGYITIENRKAYRIFGPDTNPNSSRGQFSVNPIPDYTVQGTPLTFEYIMKSWLFPPNWAPSTAYNGSMTTAYTNCGGNIYSTAANSTSGTVPMTMAYGQGQDGAVYWNYILPTSWTGSTAYTPGQYVTNGGNLYSCIYPGISAASVGPTGTAASITDGTTKWQYTTVNSWAAETQFVFGAVISTGGKYYVCSTPGVQGNNTQFTGKVAPTWTNTTQSDGTITWTWVSTSYETIISDNDICLFDEDILISGIKWRWLKAHGLEWQSTQTEYNNLVDTAMARYQTGRKISLSDNGIMLPIRPNTPEGDYGNF